MRPLRYSTLGSLALAASFAAACAAPPASGTGVIDDPGSDTPVNPDPTKPDPTNPNTISAKYSGVYTANAPVDFTQQGVLPGLTGPALASLSELHDNPGKAIVDFAYAANAPVIKDMSAFVRDVLSSVVTTSVGNLLKNHPEFDKIIGVIDSIFSITQTSVITNKITVHTPAADGTVAAELQVVGAHFELLGQKIDVPVPATLMAASKTSLTATLKARPNAPIADADVTFSGGTVSLPVGAFLLEAMGPLLFQPQFGTADLRSTLLALVPCESIATDVAAAAQNNSVLKYVVTAPVMKVICTTAVAYVADKITAEIEKLSIDNVQVMNGRAVLYDTSTLKPAMDHQSDRIADGTWSWVFGSVAVPSSLAGDRVGAAF